MPWVRIDERAMSHPKIGGLTDGAFRLWVEGLAYCQMYLTDGVISQVALRGLRAHSAKRRETLVAAHLWEDTGDGVRVHDYLEWNDSREKVLAQRATAKARMDRLRGKPDCSREQTQNERGRNERCTTPLHSTGESKDQDSPPVSDGFAAFWTAYPRHVAKVKAEQAWKAIRPKPPMDVILAAIEQQKWSETWRKHGGRFIPHPTTWIHGRRWEDDDRPPRPVVERIDWFEECQAIHGGECGLSQDVHRTRKLIEEGRHAS